MKTKFELKSFLTNNREVVIAKFEALKERDNYNGIDLKAFMVQVLRNMEANNPRSEKRASDLLGSILTRIYYSNSEIGVIFDRDADKRSKAPNDQWAAII